MIPPSHLQALSILHTRLDACRNAWVVTGSMGLALQGVPVEVHDIDLMTNRQGAYEIESLLAEYRLTPVSYLPSEHICSHFGALQVAGVRVEILGDVQKRLENGEWEEPARAEAHRRWVLDEGMRIPVLELEYEHQAYEKMGRVKKAEMIRKWIEENRFQKAG